MNMKTEENVDPFEKHINIALEAQDGKAPDPNAETETGTTATDEAPKEEIGKDGLPVEPKDSDGDKGDGAAQPKPDKEGKKDKEPTVRAKDLTLGDGTVVKGGPERRFYEQRETARQQLSHTQTLLQQERDARTKAEGELTTLRSTVESVNGADPQQVAIGVTIVRDLQRDPVGTMKKLLAEVIAQGHTIEGIGAGVDQLAIQRLIDARLPAQENNQQQTEQQILAEVEQEANQFFGRYPDAKPHDGLLAQVLQDNPGMELPTAYFQLKDAFAEKGFDWSLSLEDNLKSQSQQPQPKQQQPLPNGRPTTPPVHEAKEVKIAHEDTDMSDIVRAAMRESGLNV